MVEPPEMVSLLPCAPIGALDRSVVTGYFVIQGSVRHSCRSAKRLCSVPVVSPPANIYSPFQGKRQKSPNAKVLGNDKAINGWAKEKRNFQTSSQVRSALRLGIFAAVVLAVSCFSSSQVRSALRLVEGGINFGVIGFSSSQVRSALRLATYANTAIESNLVSVPLRFDQHSDSTVHRWRVRVSNWVSVPLRFDQHSDPYNNYLE